MANWTQSGYEGGGYMTAVAVCPQNQNIVLAGGLKSGLSRSGDKGVTWVPKNAGFQRGGDCHVASIVWHPTLTVAYILTGTETSGGLYVWTEAGGGSLTRYASEADGIWGMAGANTTFQEVSKGNPAPTGKLLAVDSTNNFLYIASFSNGIYRTPINVSTGVPGAFSRIGFVPASNGLTNYFPRCIITDDTDATVLYVSTHDDNASNGAIVAGDGRVYRCTSANTVVTGNATTNFSKFTSSPINVEELVCIQGALLGIANPNTNGAADNTNHGLYRLASAKSTGLGTAWVKNTALNTYLAGFINSQGEQLVQPSTLYYTLNGWRNSGTGLTTLWIGVAQGAIQYPK